MRLWRGRTSSPSSTRWSSRSRPCAWGSLPPSTTSEAWRSSSTRRRPTGRSARARARPKNLTRALRPKSPNSFPLQTTAPRRPPHARLPPLTRRQSAGRISGRWTRSSSRRRTIGRRRRTSRTRCACVTRSPAPPAPSHARRRSPPEHLPSTTPPRSATRGKMPTCTDASAIADAQGHEQLQQDDRRDPRLAAGVAVTGQHSAARPPPSERGPSLGRPRGKISGRRRASNA
mmetsp:Transcript_63791/g.156958  ORF Transcript_63791/g.156958 Transcript_63791/m.156958 type:complete len:231 (+) Transcript_63791:218-910(+)